MSNAQSDSAAIASRYATAIFALAAEAKKQAVIVAEFQGLAGAVRSDAALAEALANPLISRASKASVLEALAAKAAPLTRRAVGVIATEGRGVVLPAIADDLARRLAAENGEVAAHVTSARPLSAAVQKQLSEALAAATGKQVQLSLSENPALLGGLLIELGSLRLDATLAGALTTMRSELLARESIT